MKITAKKESETIRQQRLARKEFLELKKMQAGEYTENDKNTQAPIVPVTLSDKVANIWYHYGKVIIVALFIAVFLIVSIVQCATRTRYDLQIVYFTYSPIPDTYTTKMADYFEKYCDDVNGDGEVNILVINCSYNPNSNNNAILTKLQVLISSEPTALLYITDDASIKYFDNIGSEDDTFFDSEPVPLPAGFYKACNDGDFTVPDNITIGIRKVDGTLIAKDKAVKDTLNASKKILNSIK